jgi:beta-mannosidase
MSYLLLALLAQRSVCAVSPTLVDHPIASGSDPLFLDGKWIATNEGGPKTGSLAATVPGDIISDLQRASRVNDPYWNTTWRDPSFISEWNAGTWTYTRVFDTAGMVNSTAGVLLVFDGIRMGATITLNGRVLGNITDQFLRREFEVHGLLKADANILTVTFHTDIACGGRYTYSSQIDWAPNFKTFDPTIHVPDAQRITGRETFGFGIWKSVYLVPVPAAAIMHFVPHTFYAGGHPISILSDQDHQGFEIRSRVVLWSPVAVSGQLHISVQGVDMASATSTIDLSSGQTNITLSIPSSATKSVRLWHPHGHGEQARYNISASFTPAHGHGQQHSYTPAAATTSRLIGFRHVALITVNDTDPSTASAAATQNGNGHLGMFFRVNGAAVYARGGNKIPMDLLDGRLSAAAHRRIVSTAAEGNMNMLRVWGGGIWEPRAFFDACDEFGVLVYLDMQFTWGSVTVPGGADETVMAPLTTAHSHIHTRTSPQPLAQFYRSVAS